MPKVPNHELGKYFDPESEEYSPTKGDVDSEEEAVDIIRRELYQIEDELAHPKKDWYTGEENKFKATDPEHLWDLLAYLKNDHLGKVRDKKLRQQVKGEFSTLEQRVYKQYIPFIETRINYFGWQNSPLEKKYREFEIHGTDTQEIAGYFERARVVLENFKLPIEQAVDYLSDLNLLEEKLDRYRSEPTLFTFEKIEEELQKELWNFECGDDFYYRRAKESVKGLEDASAKKEELLKLDLWLAKAHSLVEISDRMLHDKMKSDCTKRAKALLAKAEYLKALNEAPRELSRLEGELKDLQQRIVNKEQVDVPQLDKLNKKLIELKEQRLDLDAGKIVDKLLKIAERLKRALAGENIDEEEDRFAVDSGNADWAWTLIGIDKNSSQEDLKKAYHKLALKYHPDFNKNKEAEEKMKKINEAVDFIRRVRGYK